MNPFLATLWLGLVAPQEIPLVSIPGGSFEMGNPAALTSAGRDHFDEGPVHTVTLSPFSISRREVSAELFRQFRPDFVLSADLEPAAAGVSWEDASSFCRWLSERTGESYRLPTEAEWEYVARSAAELGVEGMDSGAREWVRDWYGPYAAGDQVDPVGPERGWTRVVRGGLLDDGGRLEDRTSWSAPTSRSSMAPTFGRRGASSGGTTTAGLIGTWFGSENFERPQEQDRLLRLDSNWINDVARGRSWSAHWRGFIEAQVSGPVTFELQVASGARMRVGDELVLDAMEAGGTVSATVEMAKGERYPVELAYSRRGRDAFLKLLWSYAGIESEVVPPEALSHTPDDLRMAVEEGAVRKLEPGEHTIGFRVVRAPVPSTKPSPEHVPYVRRGVRSNPGRTTIGPGADKPYFRKRYLLPTPLDNSSGAEIDAVGLSGALRGHNHSPALEVCPNGDVLLCVYTSYSEYEPGVSFIASRLRFGADQWDMPEVLLDLVGVNDHASMLWTDHERSRLYLFWGAPRLVGGYPFQWTYSDDSGASWAPIRFPDFTTRIGPHSRQPINTAVQTSGGDFYLSSDGNGGTSVLWHSPDGMRTWRDTGGRSAGRHTSFALLGDGKSLVGLGGKNTDIDGWMPKAVSGDGGASWSVQKTPFPAQGTNQRPSLLRLASGRLLFAADYQHFRGQKPEGVEEGGSYVAYSDDDGETWSFKRLDAAQQHEDPARHNGDATLGYSAMRQAPNGIVHLIATMNRPCLHFAFNEAWLETGSEGRSDEELRASTASSIASVATYRETLADGTRVEYTGGVADDGRFLLHGKERWTTRDGELLREAEYVLGRPVGTEIYNDDKGLVWSWEHTDEGSYWTRRLPNGGSVCSRWVDFHADGLATTFDREGEVVGTVEFERGRRLR